MDVRDLAPALLSLGKLFDAANLVLNADKAMVNLQVKAHSAGSFEVALELFQSFGSQVPHFFRLKNTAQPSPRNGSTHNQKVTGLNRGLSKINSP